MAVDGLRPRQSERRSWASAYEAINGTGFCRRPQSTRISARLFPMYEDVVPGCRITQQQALRSLTDLDGKEGRRRPGTRARPKDFFRAGCRSRWHQSPFIVNGDPATLFEASSETARSTRCGWQGCGGADPLAQPPWPRSRRRHRVRAFPIRKSRPCLPSCRRLSPNHDPAPALTNGQADAINKASPPGISWSPTRIFPTRVAYAITKGGSVGSRSQIRDLPRPRRANAAPANAANNRIMPFHPGRAAVLTARAGIALAVSRDLVEHDLFGKTAAHFFRIMLLRLQIEQLGCSAAENVDLLIVAGSDVRGEDVIDGLELPGKTG